MIPPEPQLQVYPPVPPARAVVLVLHGGQEFGWKPVRERQLAVRRMRPFRTILQAAGARHGVAVAELRYRVRGWNGQAQSPVADAQWALSQLRERLGELPVALLGHSMGGRTALQVGSRPTVQGVAALAPWLPLDEPTEHLAGQRLLLMHGTRDRMTNPRGSAAFADRVAPLAGQLALLSVSGEGHAMLRRARLWHRVATGFCLATLPGVRDAAGAVMPEEVTAALQHARGTHPRLVV